jgi:hypothetical protein
MSLKRIISILLSLTILALLTAHAFAYEDGETVSVCCVNSNSGNLSAVDLLVLSDDLYMSADDVALFTGYSYVQSGSSLIFTRFSDQTTVSDCHIDKERTAWVPLESTLETLNTSVTAVDGVLFIDSRTTAEELLDITDMIMLEENYRYCISNFDGYSGNTGVVLATIYNVFTSGPGTWITASTGKYSVDEFEQVLVDLLTSEDSNNLEETIDLQKRLSSISKVFGVLDELSDGSEGDLFNILSLYDDALDPIKALTESAAGSIGGLELTEQLELYAICSPSSTLRSSISICSAIPSCPTRSTIGMHGEIVT